jgi:hypothetical protein
MTRRSRRDLLAGAGTALAATLAGCGGVGESLLGDDDTVSYDQAALAEVAERSPPTRPDPFPLSIPPEAMDRHRSRIRTLLGGVPESPEFPNEALSAELAEQRSHVADRFSELTSGEGSSRESRDEYSLRPSTDRERLARLRSVRAEAAGLDAAYRAAIGAIDPESPRSRRESVRSAMYDFLASWRYEGASPLEALLVHDFIETLIAAVQRSLRRGQDLPEAPRSDVFRVSDVAASVESAEAALADAMALREAYRDSLSEPTAYRPRIEAAAEQLVREFEITSSRADVHDYLDLNEPPFTRSIDGTPAEELYRAALNLVDDDFIRGRGLERQPAKWSLQAAAGLAGIETFRTVIDGIQAGEYGVPDSATEIASAYDDAVDALRMVWSGAPRGIRIELDWPATDVFDYRMREFREEVAEDGGEVPTRLINDVYGGLKHTFHYATYVPPVADHLAGVLQEP